MNQKGRTPKEKVWDQRFHHNFYSSYNIDPDMHVFLFTHSVDTTTLFRKALREYMAAHKDKAENPQYQREVFHAASSQVANGQRPVGSEIVALLAGEHYEKKEIAPKKTKPKAVPCPCPCPCPCPH